MRFIQSIRNTRIFKAVGLLIAWLTFVIGAYSPLNAQESDWSCSDDAIVVGIRGSGQTASQGPPGYAGFGRQSGEVARKLVDRLVQDGHDVGIFAIDYSAADAVWSHIPIGETYVESVRTGVVALRSLLNQVDSCPSPPKLVLVGFSQGADVIKTTLWDLVDDQINVQHLIGGIATIGDPHFDPGEPIGMFGSPDGDDGVLDKWPLPWLYQEGAVALCLANDAVCSPSWNDNDSLDVHANGYSGTLSNQAAAYLDSAVSRTLPDPIQDGPSSGGVIDGGVVFNPPPPARSMPSAGTVMLSANAWLGGNAVDVISNGASMLAVSGLSYATTPDQDQVLAGYRWQCTELINRLYIENGWIDEYWPGNAQQMFDTAPANLTRSAQGSIGNIGPGDVVVFSDGSYGHAAIVDRVEGNNVYLVSQNSVLYYATSVLQNQSLSSPFSGYSIVGVVHSPDTSQSLLVGYLSESGVFWVKDEAMNTNWHQLASDVASFQIDGQRIAALKESGKLLVKTGPSGQWQTVANGVKAFELNENRIAILKNGGGFFVKQGQISAAWHNLANGVKAFDLDENRIGVTKNNGDLWVKQGSLSANWSKLAGNVDSLVLSGDRVAMLKDGVLWVKDGQLSATWKKLASSVTKVDLDAQQLVALKTNGKLIAKTGPLSSSWSNLASDVKDFQLEDGRLAILKASGKFLMKDGSLSSSWHTLANGVEIFNIHGDAVIIHKIAGPTWAKVGSLGSSWVVLTNQPVSQVQVWK